MPPQSEFSQIERRFFQRVTQLDPTRAGEMGLEASVSQVPCGLPEIFEEQVRAFEEAGEALAGLDYVCLDAEEDLDRELVANEASLLRLLQDHGRYGPAGQDPALEVAEMLDPLFSRDFYSPQVRVEAILSRLQGVPGFLQEVRERYQRPVRLWTEEAIRSVGNTQGFLQELTTGVPALLGGKPGDLGHDPLCGAVARASEQARAALEEFGTWLKQDILPRAEHDFALGPEVFSELIRLRRLDAEVAELQELGQEKLQELGEAYVQELGKLYPGQSISQAEKTWKGTVPGSFPEILDLFRDAVARSRIFVTETLGIPLPGEELLEIRETPEFLRSSLPSAAYFDPPRFAEKQVGIYMVTPPGEGEVILEHAPGMIYNVSTHEGYPGHHLQLSWANKNPSLFRSWLSGDEFCEGWAHYCEEMMYQEGFTPVPGIAASQLLDARFRALRILIDTGLQMGTLSVEEAVQRLTIEGGISLTRARGEVGWYSFSPGYPLGYLTGKLLLQKLRKTQEETLGAAFDATAFHTQILQGGTMPIWAHAKRFSFRQNE
jgi:uncharacterized protein (DUF885 family)